MDQIYLDHNATTPILPEVTEAMADCDRRFPGNPASQHQTGRQARQVLEESREEIAALLGAKVGGRQSDRLIFTSGGTEANNLALRGMPGSLPGKIVVSPVEHPSVVGAAGESARRGHRIQWLEVDGNGVVSPEHLTECLDPQTRLVSVMLGNHETGVLQPIARLAELCRNAGVPLHSDAVQAVGKIPVDFRALDVSAMSVAAHKFHGPRGIGLLLLGPEASLEPILFGGSQQLGLRPGTEPLSLVVGLLTALRNWHRNQQERSRHLRQLRDRLESLLQQDAPEIVVHGVAADRLPHTSNLAFPGVDRQALIMAFDLNGIACSTGSACTSGSSEPSPVLQAMGLSDALIEGSLRVSIGAVTTESEVTEAASRILKIYKDLRPASQSRKGACTPPHRGQEPV